MRTALITFLFISFSQSVLASEHYEVTVYVKQQHAELRFPSFEILSFGQKVTSQTGDCTYTGVIWPQSQGSILLDGSMVCRYKEGEDHISMPSMAVNAEGGEASVELGESEVHMWKYSVEIKALGR